MYDEEHRAPSTPPRREHKLPLDADTEDSPLPAPPSISRHRYGIAANIEAEAALKIETAAPPLRRHPLAVVHSRKGSADLSIQQRATSYSPHQLGQSPSSRGPGLGAIMGMSEDGERRVATATGSARSSFSARLSGSSRPSSGLASGARREGSPPLSNAASSGSSRTTSRTSAASGCSITTSKDVPVESSSSPANDAVSAAPLCDSQTPAMGRSLRAGTVGTLRSNVPRSVKPLRTHDRDRSIANHIPARRVAVKLLELEDEEPTPTATPATAEAASLSPEEPGQDDVCEERRTSLEQAERREASDEQRSPRMSFVERVAEVTLGADEEDEEAEMPPAPLRSEAHPAARRLGQGLGLSSSSRAVGQRVAAAPPKRSARTASAAATAAAAAAAPLGSSSVINAQRQPPANAPAPKDMAAASIDHQPITINNSSCGEPVDLQAKLEAYDEVHYEDLVQAEIVRQRALGTDFLARDKREKPLAECKDTTFRSIKFKKLYRAGDGGFSSVWAVRGPMQKIHLFSPEEGGGGRIDDVAEENTGVFAMKHISLKKLEPKCRVDLLHEVETLQALASKPGNEKYILKYFGHKVTSSALKILIEVGDCDFNKCLGKGPLPPSRIRAYWIQMLEAVQFIHERAGLVHTDLKPANFLLVGDRLKLIDFGIAQKIPIGTVHISRDQIIGTPNYMAPETIMAARGSNNVYKAGKPSDVWSLGCILYQMVYGRPPFDGIPSDRKLETIMDSKHTIECKEHRQMPDGALQDVDVGLRRCIRNSLKYHVVNRATIADLLLHPWATQQELAVTLNQDAFRDLVTRLGMGFGHDNNAELVSMADRAFAKLYAEQKQSTA